MWINEMVPHTFGGGRSKPDSSRRLCISLLTPLFGACPKIGLDELPQAPAGARLSKGCTVDKGGKSADCEGFWRLE